MTRYMSVIYVKKTLGLAVGPYDHFTLYFSILPMSLVLLSLTLLLLPIVTHWVDLKSPLLFSVLNIYIQLMLNKHITVLSAVLLVS